MAKVMKTGALTAIALMMTAASVPALAQDNNGPHRGDGGDRGAPRGEAPRPQAQAPAPAPARPAPQTSAPRGWTGERPQQPANDGQWSGRRGPDRGPQSAPQAAPQGGPQNNWQRGNPGNRGNPQTPGNNDRRDWQGRGPDGQRGAPGNRQGESRPQPDRQGWRDGGPPRGGQWNGNRGDYRGDHGPDRYGYNGGGYNNAQRWNRGWRSDRRYDWNRYRDSNRGAYRLSPYYAPYRGWSYRRFGVGVYLQSLFYGDDYWIDDPYDYRLPPAYGPYRWVRYYGDALLVNIYTGEVVDAVYGIFW